MISDKLREYIRKPLPLLKSEDELAKVLKARLTKREYKLFMGHVEGRDIEYLSEKLKIDQEAYRILQEKLIKKLNQEKLKQELSE